MIEKCHDKLFLSDVLYNNKNIVQQINQLSYLSSSTRIFNKKTLPERRRMPRWKPPCSFWSQIPKMHWSSL